MKKLHIKYKRYGITKGIDRTVPEKWGEMTGSQFIAMVRVAQHDMPVNDFPGIFLGLPKGVELDIFQLYQLMGLMPDEIKDARVSHFFIQKIGKLYAPADKLSGMSLQQFMTVDTFFMQASDQLSRKGEYTDSDALCKMIGALYIRKKEAYFIEDSDRKLINISHNAELARKADKSVKMGILINWGMIHRWLSKAFPLLFTEEEQPKKKMARQKSQWLTILDNFVGDDISHLQTYRSMECTDAFRLMNHRIYNYNQQLLKNRK